MGNSDGGRHACPAATPCGSRRTRSRPCCGSGTIRVSTSRSLGRERGVTELLYPSTVRARTKGRWRDHPAREELLGLFREADVLSAGCSCTCATATVREDARCCRFAVTGREPYPTPLELCEVNHAIRASGGKAPGGKASGGKASQGPSLTRRGGRGLPLAREQGGDCPLLADDGRCGIYASRPFGCRTFFCQGHEAPRHVREAHQALGRRISALAARYFPRDPGPRPFTRALAGPLPDSPSPPPGEPREP